MQIGELDGAGVGGDEPQGAAGFDGGQLGGVADEPDDGPAFAGVAGDPVQDAGSRHAGLVGQDEVHQVFECADSQLDERGDVGFTIEQSASSRKAPSAT